MATIADSIPNDKCLTIDDVATEFNLGNLRMRQIIEKAIKSKYIQSLTKKDGRRILYAPQMVDQLRKTIESGKLGKFNAKRSVVSSLKHAQFVLTVPIFDEDIGKLLITKFGSTDKMNDYLKSILEDTVKPILAKKRELMEKYERELAELVKENSLGIGM